MTLRKFKHKELGWVATKMTSCRYSIYSDDSFSFDKSCGVIRKEAIENSTDWEEITEKPILVTEDGYEVYSYHNTLKEVTEDFEILPIDPDDASQNPVFYEIANAKSYVEKHKPRYSDEDLNFLEKRVQDVFDDIDPGSLHMMRGRLLSIIDELKEKKND